MLPKQEPPWGGDVLQSSSPLRTEALLFGIGPAVFQEETYSMSDAELRVKLAANARRLIEAECDIHRNTERIRKIFQSAARTGASA